MVQALGHIGGDDAREALLYLAEAAEDDIRAAAEAALEETRGRRGRPDGSLGPISVQRLIVSETPPVVPVRGQDLVPEVARREVVRLDFEQLGLLLAAQLLGEGTARMEAAARSAG